MEADGYKPARKKEKNRDCQQFEAERPLELAQMDILELFINKLKLYLILLIDDFSPVYTRLSIVGQNIHR